MQWKRLRKGLWRRADWSVVRGYGRGWKCRLPEGRYITRTEYDGHPLPEAVSDAWCEGDAKSFRSQDEAMTWLDAYHPTEEVYDAAD